MYPKVLFVLCLILSRLAENIRSYVTMSCHLQSFISESK